MTQKVEALLDYAASRGIRARVSSTLRDCATQNALFEQGRTTPGPVVTGAKGCQSWHTWGRAVDILIDGPREGYAILGDWWKRRGGDWGGDFTNVDDPGHFEWHPDMELRDICPTGNECPAHAGEWPEDRPLFVRPLPRALFGAAVASAGLALAYVLVKR